MDIKEALSIAQRKRRAMIMKKNKNKIAMARRREERKPASKERIEKRAKKEAIKKVKEKYAGGKSLNDLTTSEKSRLEKLVTTKKRGEVERLTKKLIKIVRKRDKEKKRGKIKEEVEISENFLNEWFDLISEGASIKDLTAFFKRMGISNELDKAVLVYMHEIDKNEKQDRMKLISDVALMFKKLRPRELFNHILKLISKGKIDEFYDPKKDK